MARHRLWSNPHTMPQLPSNRPPKQMVWATDVHLDHVPKNSAAADFGRELAECHPETSGLLLTGDIGEAASVGKILRDLKRGFGRPVYFVLGNHDYYGGSFVEVDSMVQSTCRHSRDLFWIRETSLELLPGVVLVGTCGWYDARYGNTDTDLRLTDFVRISDLFAAQDESHHALLAACAGRADLLAQELRRQLESVALGLDSASKYPMSRRKGRCYGWPTRSVLVLTHVPPFAEACTYQGQPSDGRWPPFFASKATGEVLLEFADAHPEVQVTVLCGHTHDETRTAPRPNLSVHCGGARYGTPTVAGIVTFDGERIVVKPS